MEEKRKSRIGRVLSNKMAKTVIVAVDTPWQHPVYRKTIRRVVKYKAHDETNQCQPGDLVRIVETRPLSKEKHWRVAEIMIKEKQAIIQPKEVV
ncbi:MAG: 30S ribosomal protein S17 [Dehalococcoidales bacterium]|nr:30S ribosomal protein S17 [Dehalococcoidales bacterium]